MEIITNNTTTTLTDPELISLMRELKGYLEKDPRAFIVTDENYYKMH